jgi:short-subunit dehydrogenase
MKKKICLITGVTSGLGRSLAVKLSNEGFNLILVAKSKAKLKSLSKKLGKFDIQYFDVDLSIFKEINEFTKKISNVDILINNAGNFYLKKAKNDKTMMINYFAPFYLIKKLILKKKLKKKLVINISSHTISKSRIPLSKIKNLTDYNGWEVYKFSKLLIFLIMNILSKKYKNMNFISFDPGRMRTNFGSENNILMRYLIKLYLKILGKNPIVSANKIIKIIKTYSNNKNLMKTIDFKNNSLNLNFFNLKKQNELLNHTINIIRDNEKNIIRDNEKNYKKIYLTKNN